MSTKNNDGLEMIFGRRSIRVYSPGEVSEPDVDKMLEAAMAAPSAMTKDPWRFVVVRDRQALRRMAAELPGGKMLSTAAMAIVVCGDLEVAFERQISYLLQDCAASIQNLLLAAHGLGYGACWVGVHPSEEAMSRIRAMYSLPAPIVPVAVISLGVPGEEPGSRTRYTAGYVRRERW